MITSELFQECGHRLSALAQEVLNTQIEDKFEVNLYPSEFIESYPDSSIIGLSAWLKKKPNCKYIYVFSIESNLPVGELFEQYKAAKGHEKKENGTRSFARAIRESSILYVGSSRSLETRIMQHLGHKNKTVYSMQLKHWLKVDSIKSLRINVWKFSDQTNQTVLQAIEDFLWDRLQPMLGKQGGK